MEWFSKEMWKKVPFVLPVAIVSEVLEEGSSLFELIASSSYSSYPWFPFPGLIFLTQLQPATIPTTEASPSNSDGVAGTKL